MKILAIETSCDDTSIAILEIKGKKPPRFKVLSNIISSQVKIHKKWGGVYPTLARREHQKNLVPVLNQALKKAKLLKDSKSFISTNKTLKKILEREESLYDLLIKFLKKYRKPKIDSIAVTVGPGLDPCLWTGVNFAKSLAYFWNLPIIPTNHIEGHILANLLSYKNIFPAVSLIVSGGHTQLILIEKLGKYKIIGETKDDAAGECLDKTARMLGLGYPGGPEIAKKARKGSSFKINLPRPMINQKNYDFSFSGLKTAVLYDYKNRSLKIRKTKEYIKEMCEEIQQSVIDVLIKKTMKALKDHKAKTILLGGGVAANNELRKQFQSIVKNQRFLVPEKDLCTDNAVMTAITAYFHSPKNWKKIKAKPNFRLGI